MPPRLYSFIKVTDNNDVSNFVIEATCMKNPKARICCLRTQLFSYEDNLGEFGKWRPVWDLFYKDYSFYVCDRRYCENLREARLHKDRVAQAYRDKIIFNLKKIDLKTISPYIDIEEDDEQ